MSLCFTTAAVTFVFSASPPPAQPAAPTTTDLKQLYTDGMAAFQAGDYQKAASNLETVLAQAAPDAQLEPVYFTLGAAWFNLKQYPKAIQTLKAYQTKFPKGARVAEAQFSIGQASFMDKDYAGAVESFKALETNPRFREQALYFEGSAYKEEVHPDQAIAVFQKLIGPEIQSTLAANGAIVLAGMYAQKHDSANAIALLQRIQKRVAMVDNVVKLNTLAVQMGDEMLKDKKPDVALACYRVVRSRAEVIGYQTARVQAMEQKVAQNLTTVRAEPARVMELSAENTQLRASIEEGKKLLDDFQKLPDFQPGLLLRMGRCWYDLGKKWESIVVYDELLRKYPDGKENEEALFAMIVSSAETNRPKQTQDYCQEYLKKYPAGANASAVGYLLGATALQANDLQAAENYFGRMLKEQPASTFREEILFQLGNVRFTLGKYDEAAKDYEKYRGTYPKGTHIEEAVYRLALASLFAGKYEDAMNKVTSYIAKYPRGNFIADAKYRLAVCKYAASLYDEVVADCRAWEKEFGKDTMIGEVMALLADSLAASNKEDEAAEVYIRASHVASSAEVVNYALSSAEKLLQKKGAWDRIGKMYEEFAQQHPDDPEVVTAVYWIGKAKVHEGKVDDAKHYIAATIKKYISDQKRDAVEQLLTQLAQLCVRKKTAVAAPAPLPGEAVSSPSPTVAQTQADPGAELDALLGDAAANQSPLAKARILYAKSELARLRRQVLEEQRNLQEIADKFKPEGLSPMLLAQVGDYLLDKNTIDKARGFYTELMDNYPKSDLLEFAYNGMGEISYRQKQYDKALKLFSDAIDKAGASQKLKDVTVGKAKTLLALGHLEDSKKIFEQIASIREWRGEATAFSVYSLGEIAQKQGKFAEAIAFYQRVYVAYQRFLPWVAKSYTSSGECFQKLGKTQEALNTYKEMLRNAKLATFPETETARKRLQEAGQG